MSIVLADRRYYIGMKFRAGQVVFLCGWSLRKDYASLRQFSLLVSRGTWILDAGAAAWRAGPDTPERLSHANLAVAGDRLYLLGGLVDRAFVPSGAAWRLADDASRWEAIAPLPAGEERGAAAVIARDDAIVLAGGATATDALTGTLVYDIAGDAWQAGVPLPSARSHAIGALGPGGEAIVIGGLATIDASMPLAEVLALDGATWRVRAAMPTARGGCAAAMLDGIVYCAGGEAGTSAQRVVETFDPATDAWSTAAPLPRGRAGTGGAALDGELWIAGGAHRLAWEPIADVDVLMP